MIVAAITGFVIGYLLAIPPGPIGMASVRMALRDGWRPGLYLAVGAGLFDVMYCILAMWASTAVVSALSSWEAESPLLIVAFQFAVVIGMVWFGVLQLRENSATPAAAKPPSSKLVANLSTHGPLFVGVGFAIANLANPTFIPALVAMTTFVQRLAWFEESFYTALAFSIGFGAGNMLWLVTLVRIVLALREKLTPTLILRIQQASGVTLIGFAVFYGFRIVVNTPWHDFPRLFTAVYVFFRNVAV